MKDTITLKELRQTEFYRKEQTRHLRELLEPKTLTDEDIEYIVKQFFNCHPETKLTEQFVVSLYSVIGLCKAILKKA